MPPVETIIDKIASYLLAPFESLDTFVHAIGGALTAFTDLQSKTGWLYFLTSIAIAVVVFNVGRRRGWIESRSLRDFLFPRQVFLHRSAIVDYKYTVVDLTIKAVVYAPVFTGFTVLAYNAFTFLFGRIGDLGLRVEDPFSGTIFLAVLIFLATDFCFFFAHYLMHKVPALWYFHEVHHSAEVLTPITVYRVHPVEDLINGLIGAFVLGGIGALYTSTTANVPQLPTFFGVNVLTFVFFGFAFQLRHSHVWLSYGPVLSRLFISPAQHQIHHSSEQRHWDKNFGFMLAVWDLLFRTLYVPSTREKFRLGVPGADPVDFSTVPRLYFLPFLKAGRHLFGRRANPPREHPPPFPVSTAASRDRSLTPMRVLRRRTKDEPAPGDDLGA